MPSTATNASAAAIKPMRAGGGVAPGMVVADDGTGRDGGGCTGGGCTGGNAAARCMVEVDEGFWGCCAAICEVLLPMPADAAAAAASDDVAVADGASGGDVIVVALAFGNVVPHCTQNLAVD